MVLLSFSLFSLLFDEICCFVCNFFRMSCCDCFIPISGLEMVNDGMTRFEDEFELV